MNRRDFLIKLPAFGAGVLTLAGGAVSWSKELPSDPKRGNGEAHGPGFAALNPFEKNGGFPVEKALLGRKSTRAYNSGRELTLEEISRLLWAATGVNRPNGRRTVPSALAKYPVDVLAALPGGVYLYQPMGHQLKKMLSKDIRAIIPNQEGFKSAGMIVLYVIDKDRVPRGRIEWADIEIGCMGQSLFLEATSLGLGSCIFAYISVDQVTKSLDLKENQVLRIAQAVGGVR